MTKLYAIQARFGDCLLIEYGGSKPSYLLIDGGPSNNYDDFLKPALQDLVKKNNKLEAVIVSHVDNDHIVGVLDLLVDIKFQKDAGTVPFLKVNQLWFNTFKGTIDNTDLEARINAINTIAGVNGIKMQEMGMAVNGIKEGYQVLSVARFLDIPINPGTEKGFFLGGQQKPFYKNSNIAITVVGPTVSNLQALQKQWNKWVSDNEDKIQSGQYTKDFAAMSDRSIPNLSSIVLLVKAGTKTILLTGDCRGDHLQEGLIASGLSTDGKYHATVFKVPHHGSQRNVTRKFFSEVTADTYVISADGTYDNPDYDTLTWIVETAKEAGRIIRIVFTNETPSTKKLLNNYATAEWGYQPMFLPAGKNYLQIPTTKPKK
jgi:beta-lactamase superfamily II metal-dependent hydrolase